MPVQLLQAPHSADVQVCSGLSRIEEMPILCALHCAHEPAFTQVAAFTGVFLARVKYRLHRCGKQACCFSHAGAWCCTQIYQRSTHANYGRHFGRSPSSRCVWHLLFQLLVTHAESRACLGFMHGLLHRPHSPPPASPSLSCSFTKPVYVLCLYRCPAVLMAVGVALPGAHSCHSAGPHRPACARQHGSRRRHGRGSRGSRGSGGSQRGRRRDGA